MIGLTRRGFLGALAAAGATVAVAPNAAFSRVPAASAVENTGGTLRLINKTLILDRPLVLRGFRNVEIRGCMISRSENFEGDALIEIHPCESLKVEDCWFSTVPRIPADRHRHKKWSDFDLEVWG